MYYRLMSAYLNTKEQVFKSDQLSLQGEKIIKAIVILKNHYEMINIEETQFCAGC